MGAHADTHHRHLADLRVAADVGRLDVPLHLTIEDILQPHLSLIQAVIKRQATGSLLVIDFQTKKYAQARKDEAAPAK